MSILRSSITSLVLLTTITILGGSSVLGAPPVPFLDDNEPGIQMLFSGDPNTTEDGCDQFGPRAAMGDPSGKNHNELLECDNWDFGTQEWGQTSFLQGAFFLGESPFSANGGWECSGNVFNPGTGFAGSPCANSTIRVVATFKNTPAPGMLEGHPMSEAKDWVLRFDFKVETIPGDTFGGDKFLEAAPNILTITGASENGSPRSRGSFLNGQPNRYKVRYGPAPQGANGPSQEFIIPQQLNQGTFTLHYKASNQRLDLWLDDTKLLEDFESYSGRYKFDRMQLGGGGVSFENALYDNIILGVLGESGPIPGDANGDGVVDVADLGILGANFNLTGVTFSNGDFNGDGVVDVADLGILGANWTSAQGLSFTQALRSADLMSLLPEPATAAVLAIGLACLGCRRR